MRAPPYLAALTAIGAALSASVGHAVLPRKAAPSSSAEQAVDRRFDQLVTETHLPFAGLIVLDGGAIRYRRLTKSFCANRAVPIASASKWVAAALIMTGVDRGELSLDDKVSRWIPDAPPGTRDATLAQLLGHSSGMALGGMTDMGPVTSLEESVKRLFRISPARAPGSGFAYGGPSYQVAALMLERAAGKPFATLFAQRLAGPLGMTTARMGSPPTWGTSDVPWVGGGMAMSLDDYAKFLAMILNRGRAGSTRILSEASVAEMERDRVGTMSIAYNPRIVREVRYGLGVWCEAVAADGRCSRVSSPGAFGAYPWLDRKTGQAGIFLTRSRLVRVAGGADELRELAATALGEGGR